MPNNKLQANSPTGHRGYNPSRLKVAGYSVSRPDRVSQQFTSHADVRDNYAQATKVCQTLNDIERCKLGLFANDSIPHERRWKVIPMTEAQEPYAHGGPHGDRWHSTEQAGEMETEYD